MAPRSDADNAALAEDLVSRLCRDGARADWARVTDDARLLVAVRGGAVGPSANSAATAVREAARQVALVYLGEGTQASEDGEDGGEGGESGESGEEEATTAEVTEVADLFAREGWIEGAVLERLMLARGAGVAHFGGVDQLLAVYGAKAAVLKGVSEGTLVGHDGFGDVADRLFESSGQDAAAAQMQLAAAVLCRGCERGSAQGLAMIARLVAGVGGPDDGAQTAAVEGIAAGVKIRLRRGCGTVAIAAVRALFPCLTVAAAAVRRAAAGALGQISGTKDGFVILHPRYIKAVEKKTGTGKPRLGKRFGVLKRMEDDTVLSKWLVVAGGQADSADVHAAPVEEGGVVALETREVLLALCGAIERERVLEVAVQMMRAIRHIVSDVALNQSRQTGHAEVRECMLSLLKTGDVGVWKDEKVLKLTRSVLGCLCVYSRVWEEAAVAESLEDAGYDGLLVIERCSRDYPHVRDAMLLKLLAAVEGEVLQRDRAAGMFSVLVDEGRSIDWSELECEATKPLPDELDFIGLTALNLVLEMDATPEVAIRVMEAIVAGVLLGLGDESPERDTFTKIRTQRYTLSTGNVWGRYRSLALDIFSKAALRASAAACLCVIAKLPHTGFAGPILREHCLYGTRPEQFSSMPHEIGDSYFIVDGSPALPYIASVRRDVDAKRVLVCSRRATSSSVLILEEASFFRDQDRFAAELELCAEAGLAQVGDLGSVRIAESVRAGRGSTAALKENRLGKVKDAQSIASSKATAVKEEDAFQILKQLGIPVANIFPIELPGNFVKYNQLQSMDTSVVPMNHQIGVIITKDGDTTHEDVCGHNEGTEDYRKFVQSLGKPVLREVAAALEETDRLGVRCFADAVLAPSLDRSQFRTSHPSSALAVGWFESTSLTSRINTDDVVRKRVAEILNLNVCVVFNESCRRFDPATLKSAMTFVQIIISPTQAKELYRVKVLLGNPRLPNFGPLSPGEEGHIVRKDSLVSLVIATAVNGNIACHAQRDMHLCSEQSSDVWAQRMGTILKLVESSGVRTSWSCPYPER